MVVRRFKFEEPRIEQIQDLEVLHMDSTHILSLYVALAFFLFFFKSRNIQIIERMRNSL